MVAHTFDFNTQERQADLPEFEASVEHSGTARTPPKKKKTGHGSACL